MDSKKFLIGGIVGGIAYFLLGWLAYGMLLTDFYAKNAGTATGVAKDPKEMIYWALVLGNFAGGFLMAYVFSKAKIASAAAGAATGAVLGLLITAMYDFIMYGTANIMNMTGLCADLATSTVLSAIVGAIVGFVMGMGKKAS